MKIFVISLFVVTCNCTISPWYIPREFKGLVHNGEPVNISQILLKPECGKYNELYYFRGVIDPGSDGYKIPYTDNIETANVLGRFYPNFPLSPDWKGPGWYRFIGPSGTRMPESSPEENHCGTFIPGWVAGLHPTTPGETKDVTVCFHKGKVGCEDKVNAKITNCNGYFVYNLPDTPEKDQRYCSIS
eukprot:TRINITY_DN9256_c0_g1_i1.p1 TRINITY_DN9256_c0_g1~~TRINITY_DN9256_c0_g1_i1.p1  ORF type:complete len:187 (-),score=0.28 TRINITY_DN9256_c0_g1_i1:176-736(-)